MARGLPVTTTAPNPTMPHHPTAPPAADAEARQTAQARARQLRELLRRTEETLTTDPPAAGVLAEQAEDQAREIGANGELALALMFRSKARFFAHAVDEALQLMQRAAALAESDGHPAVRAKVMTALGSQWANLGLGEQALPHLEAAAEELAGAADPAGVALLQSLVGGVLAQVGQAERGRAQLEQSLTAFMQLQMNGRARETRHNLACLANLQGRHETALGLSNVSAPEALKANDWLYAHIEATATDALAGLGRHDEAAQRARQALADTPAGTRGAYDLLLALGRAELGGGRTVEAGEALAQALAVARQGGQPDDPLLLAALADWHARRGDADAAVQARRAAEAAAQGGGDAQLGWRLKALQASVELQTVRLRYGRIAAERTRLSAQLEHSRRLLAAETQAHEPVLRDDTPLSPHPGFDDCFDGESAGYGLRYQPIVDLSDGRVLGVEALLRLATKPGGRAAPLEFIRRLEAGGEIGSVGHWVARRACHDIAALQAASQRPLRLVVNVSCIELRRPGFADDLLRVAARAGLDARQIELDIDGLDEPGQLAPVLGTLQALRGAGVGLTLDNFGAGGVAWSVLAELPLTRLKIDRRIVAGVGHSARHDTLLASMLQTAANLGLAVGVVGVETVVQWQALQALGCREGQGFLFATPLSLGAARQLPAVLPAAAG